QENFSWNNGAEGPSADPDIVRRRKADQRALLATLFASRGTIQLTAGDEFGRSQSGNNNAYAQDNEITWLNWEERDTELESFVEACAAFRQANPALSDVRFLTEAEWYDLDGNPMTTGKWQDPCTEGFEVHFRSTDHERLKVRIDRGAKLCTVECLGDPAH